jgi:hypothetical protein
MVDQQRLKAGEVENDENMPPEDLEMKNKAGVQLPVSRIK